MQKEKLINIMPNGTTQHLWEYTIDQFRACMENPSHPFRYSYFGTIGNYPQIRTVVMREIDENNHVWIYSDSRTPKVSQIRKNRNVSLLAYHPIQQLQVRINGHARLFITGEKYAAARASIQHQRDDYNSLYPPGSDNLSDRRSSYVHFILIELVPVEWDILQLGPTGHYRAKYVNIDGHWRGYEVVP